MSKQSFSNTCIFSLRHITTFLCLGTLDSTSLCLEPFKKMRLPTKSTKMQKCGINYTTKWALAYGPRAETRRQNFALFDLSWDCLHQVTEIFCSSRRVSELCRKCHELSILMLQIKFREQENLQIQNCK